MTKKLSGRPLDVIIMICAMASLISSLYWLFVLIMVPYFGALLFRVTANKFFNRKTGKGFLLFVNTLLVVFYSIACKLYVLDIYRVSSDSMEGTLKRGDVLLINKLAYGPLELQSLKSISWIRIFQQGQPTHEDEYCILPTRKKGYSKIQRNDIFIYKLFPGYFVVKRCIGVPGDTLQIRNDSIYIDNKQTDFVESSISQYKICFYQQKSVERFLGTIPMQQIVSVNPDSNFIVANLQSSEVQRLSQDTGVQVERKPNKKLDDKEAYFHPRVWTINNLGAMIIPFQGYTIIMDSLNRSIYGSTIGHWDCNKSLKQGVTNTITYHFQENFYFMMGDNKGKSEDSRYLGYIPEKNIIGKVMLVLYSRTEGKFNWRRFLKLVC